MRRDERFLNVGDGVGKTQRMNSMLMLDKKEGENKRVERFVNLLLYPLAVAVVRRKGMQPPCFCVAAAVAAGSCFCVLRCCFAFAPVKKVKSRS